MQIETRLADGAGSSHTTVAIAASGGVQPGETKRYQVVYRTIVAPPCGPGVFDFNTTNGYELVWVP